MVGAWWPARPDAPMAGVTYWREAAQLKRNEANDLRNERSLLAVNQGRTADDLLERYWRGEQRLATIAHQCEVKSDQSEQVADTVNYLRDRLTEIAQSGNQQINQILAGKGPIEAKVAAVNAVIEQSNAMADHVGATAMSNIIDATQRVFDETIGGDAHTWLRDHGEGAGLMNYSVLPPEINSLRMFTGAGSAPMLAASVAWDGLAAELAVAASSFGSVTSGLAGQSWQGAAAAMAAAAAPYAGWLAAAAARAAGASAQAKAVASAFEAARAATVHPMLVAANRNAFVQLVLSNLFGQNAPAIAAAEAMYEQMWAADVAAMVGYHGGASAAAASFNRGTDAPDEQRSSHRRWNDRRADIHRSRNRRRAPKVMRGVQTGSAGGPNRDKRRQPGVRKHCHSQWCGDASADTEYDPGARARRAHRCTCTSRSIWPSYSLCDGARPSSVAVSSQ